MIAAILAAIPEFLKAINNGFQLAWSLRKTPAEQQRLLMLAVTSAVKKARTGDTSAIEAIIRS